ncbi:MAG: DNA cytosine methyltransferase [Clostridia bacterium]|nr:DNA cytosine methyltransferase [Clostridia bacterium]
MSEIQCKLIGRLHGGKWDKIYDVGRRVYSVEGLAPTLHTCGGGNIEPKILEPCYRFYNQAKQTLDNNACVYGDTIDAFNKRVNKSGISPTITTRPDGFKTAILAVTPDNRIRKLTEQECFRLMGVKDTDYERIAKNQSKSGLYHLAGDSIVTNVLSAMFAEMM